jgi:hypothetical protein
MFQGLYNILLKIIILNTSFPHGVTQTPGKVELGLIMLKNNSGK